MKKFIWVIIILILLLIGGVYYWGWFGPNQFIKKCDEMFPANNYTYSEIIDPRQENYDLYMDCMRAKRIIIDDEGLLKQYRQD